MGISSFDIVKILIVIWFVIALAVIAFIVIKAISKKNKNLTQQSLETTVVTKDTDIE